MAIYIDIYQGVTALSPVVFNSFVEAVDGVRTTFTFQAGDECAVKSDFVVFRNGQLVDRNDYSFATPKTVGFTGFIPSAPDRVEYLILQLLGP